MVAWEPEPMRRNVRRAHSGTRKEALGCDGFVHHLIDYNRMVWNADKWNWMSSWVKTRKKEKINFSFIWVWGKIIEGQIWGKLWNCDILSLNTLEKLHTPKVAHFSKWRSCSRGSAGGSLSADVSLQNRGVNAGANRGEVPWIQEKQLIPLLAINRNA